MADQLSACRDGKTISQPTPMSPSETAAISEGTPSTPDLRDSSAAPHFPANQRMTKKTQEVSLPDPEADLPLYKTSKVLAQPRITQLATVDAIGLLKESSEFASEIASPTNSDNDGET